jgi:hypothetical protein
VNILFTGSGKAGSWQIRGEQLGSAVGAAIHPQASVQHIARSDLVVVVKRCPDSVLMELRRQKKQWVFDVLDCYPQPQCGFWSKRQSIEWVKNEIARLDPSAIIWPNRQMFIDCGDDRPSCVLYHHFRPSISSHTPKARLLTVAYEGSEKYLDGWKPILADQCTQRGWSFVCNPSSISDADVVVALRASQYAGYAQVNWKSNVKLANAQGSGVPFIGQPEKGYLETASGSEIFIETKEQLSDAFDEVSSFEVRQRMSQIQTQKKYSIAQAAIDLRSFLYGL